MPVLVRYWLMLIGLVVVAMMLIGAATRLTDSGLSMAEWRPIIGSLPPLSNAEWERVFALYQETAQFRLQNSHMSMPEFKTIFWWEYGHRIFGRFIGIVFFIPLVIISVNRRIRQSLSRGSFCQSLGSVLLWVRCRGALAGGWSKAGSLTAQKSAQ